MRSKSLGVLAVVAVAGLMYAVPSPASSKGFDQCGDVEFFHGIRAEGVGCKQARKIAHKWYAHGVDQDFPRVVKFKQWRCTSKSYGDGVNVKCKRKPNDEVRFAAGG